MDKMTGAVKSADRVMRVLCFLATRRRPVPTMIIADRCELPRSSAYHLLNTMRCQHFVTYFADERAWSLGPAAVELASAYPRSEPLMWLGKPRAQELADDIGCVIHIGALHGPDVRYLHRADPQGAALGFITRTGMRLPAHLTALGRAILMHMSKAEIRALYPLASELPRLTGRGPTLVTQLEAELDQARRQGFAVDRGLVSRNVVCAAAAVFARDSRPLGAIGAAWIDERVSLDTVGAKLRQAARGLSTALGCQSAGENQPERSGLRSAVA